MRTDHAPTETSFTSVIAIPAVILAYFYGGIVTASPLIDRAAISSLMLTMFVVSTVAWESVDKRWLRIAVIAAAVSLCGMGAQRILSPAFDADRANTRRCLALQRDMLSAQPRKPDGPALFQAFGCRAQGEGSVMVPPTRGELAHARQSR